MKWKQIYAKLDTLPDAELESWASKNLWNDTDSKHERIAQDLQQFNGPNLLRILACLAPSLHPAKLLQTYFTLLTSVLLDRNESLERINQSTKISTLALKSEDESLATDLKGFAKKFFDCLVHESGIRWDTFEKITQGTPKVNQIALDPSRIPRLEYVLFSFGMAKPLIFYELLNDLANAPDTRLQALMLLKTFLILEGAPTYYLIDSELYKTVIMSALTDTEISVFLTSITILTIVLPIVATKAVEHLDHLISILIFALKWEVSFPNVITKISSSMETHGKSIDEILQLHSINSTRFCINQYFTVLYGMFPCNVMEAFTLTLKEKSWKEIKPDLNFIPVNDPFKKLRLDEQKSNHNAMSARIKDLISSHRCHFNTVCSNCIEERENPWFINKESSEIMITCFDLECSDSFSAERIEKRGEFIGEIANHILSLNRQLYGDLYRTEPTAISVIDGNSEKDSVALLKIFYTILMNESFFKECMRQYHIFHIRILKRREISAQLVIAGEENTELKMKNFEAEVKSMRRLNEDLNKEIVHLNLNVAATTALLKDHIKALEEKLENCTFELGKSNEQSHGWNSKSIELAEQLREAEFKNFNCEILLKEQIRELTIVKQQNEALSRLDTDLPSAVPQGLIQELQAKNYAQNDAIQVLTNQYNQLKKEFDSNLYKWEVFELNQPIIADLQEEIKQQAKRIQGISVHHAEILQAQEQKFETVKKLLMYTQTKLFDK